MKEKIISCEYPPGMCLNESVLIAELNLTRMPLRDALRQLEFEGLVRIRPKKGVVITEVTAEDFTQTTEALVMMISHVIRHYSHWIDRARIGELYQRMSSVWNEESVRNDLRRVNAFCFELYDYLASLCGNKLIQDYLTDLLEKKRRFINMMEPKFTANYFYNYFQAPHDTLDAVKALSEGLFKDAAAYIDMTLREECHCQIMVWINANRKPGQ